MAYAAPAHGNATAERTKTITLAAGCFWCAEAVYQRVAGVLSVESGYMGGREENPSYAQVCAGETGHAEAVQLRYDSSRVSTTDLVEIFFQIHDPTTRDRQGHDIGTQYRSVVFFYDDEQYRAAYRVMDRIQRRYIRQVLTQVVAAMPWYPADQGHQDYYNQNWNRNPYCRSVIAPKLMKVAHDKFQC